MFIDDYEYIRARLGVEELLAQFAEECAELGKAALKLRRVYSGKNPTPVKRSEAFDNVVEEMADVFLCISVLDFDSSEVMNACGEISDKKLTRWVERLKERDSYGSKRVSESAEETGLADSE